MNLRFRGLVLATAFALGVTIFINGCGSSTGGNSTQQQQPSVTISGASQVRLGSTDSFTVTVTNLTNSSVTWKVNGIAGGNSTVGTISVAGVYTPPSTIPATNTVTVSAVSVASPTVYGTAPVSILNPIPSITGAGATPVSGTSYTLEVDGSSFVSGAQIQAGGANVATTFVSSTELEATVTIPSGTNTLSVNVMNRTP